MAANDPKLAIWSAKLVIGVSFLHRHAMKYSIVTLTLAASSLFFAAPALAMPADPAELNSVIQTKYKGDAAAYVTDNRGEFRKMGCNGRVDLLQALLDAGLVLENLEPGRYSAHAQAIRCAFEKGKMEALALLLTPDAMTMFEEVEFGQAWQASLLSQAIYWDSYDRVRYLLENGVHAAEHDKEAAILTREEHLLLAAYGALDTEKEDAIRAFQDAGFANILDAARSKANYRYVIDRARGGGGGGGGGSLLRSVLGGVAGAALGGSAGAALGFLGGGTNASGDGDASGATQGNGPLPLATNRAELGAQLNPVTAPRRGLQVQQVDNGGPAVVAGLMQGDVILSIAGMPVASRGSFYVATEEAFGKETFEVEYLRDGALQTAVFDKRKASQGTVAATPMRNSAPRPEGSTRAPDPASTLEELEKLGDLRDRGVLSEEEFETMKARILSAEPEPSEATPNPVVYGVEMGEPIASYTVLDELKNSRFEIAPPTSISGLATLVVQGTPETGVCAVEMFGTIHKNDRRGRAALMDYDRQRQELDHQYGLPSERDFLRANSEWDDADEYALSTWHGHRSKSSVWQLDGSKGIATVYLSIFAHRPNDLYVKVSYDFSNYEQCKSIIDVRSAQVG